MEWELPSSFFKLIFQSVQFFIISAIFSIALINYSGISLSTTAGNNSAFIITFMMLALVWIINMVKWEL